jgi:predicted esterase
MRSLVRIFRSLSTLCLFLQAWPCRAGGIFNDYPQSDGDRRPAMTYEEDRIISGDLGAPEVLSFRVSLYGSPAPALPLLVQVHEWGGSFAREEEVAGYEPYEYNFVMLYFQYKPSSGNEDDWWFGTRWGGVCRMWAHDAVMGIVREAASTSLVSDHLPGVSIDPERVYLFGTSIGGTGAWQLGVRNPDVFAAVHAHSGFARFTPPVGPFQEQFEEDIVGGPGEAVVMFGDDGAPYPARDYSNLAWWLVNHRGAAWETAFITFTHGLADEIVPAASGGDLMAPVLEGQKRGFFYNRHGGGHSDECFVRLNWMWNFRRDRSFLSLGGTNLYEMSWEPASIGDQPGGYQVRLTGTGAADVTPRRLQNFRVASGVSYPCRLDTADGPATNIVADANALLTVPGVPAGHLLIIGEGGGVPDSGIVPRITINGSDGPVALTATDRAAVIVSLDPGLHSGENGDWWLAVETPFGWRFFTFSGWTSALTPAHQGPLFTLDSYPVFDTALSGLPTGVYTLYFGVDLHMDGVTGWGGVSYDSVTVNLAP